MTGETGGERSWTLSPEGLVLAASGILGAVSAFSGEHPTALWWWNPILTSICTLVACLAASRATWGTVAFAGVVATVATSLVTPNLWTLLALGATALVITSVMGDRQLGPLLKTVAMGVSMLALYRIPPTLRFGVPSIIAAVAVIPVVLSGWRASSPTIRDSPWLRWSTRAVAATVLATATSVVAAAAFAAPVPGEARATINLVDQGNLTEAGTSLRSVASSTKRVSWALNGPWAWPARLVPIVSQHIDLAGTGAGIAYQGTSAASNMLTQAGNGSLQSSNGAINLEAIDAIIPEGLRAVEALDELDGALESHPTNWLIPPLQDQIDKRRSTIHQAALAADSTEALAGQLTNLLGAAKPMRYFVIFGTPAESRELGGLVGAYAVVEVDQGRISLLDAGSNNQLIEHVHASGNTLADPDRYSVWFQKANVATHPQNLTASPRLQEVAAATRELVAPIAGGDIDAVAYVDPFAVQALVAMVGPIEIIGIAEPLDGTNTAEYLLVEQYKIFDDAAGRKEFLVTLLEAMFGRIMATNLGTLAPSLPELGPLIDQKRIQLTTYDDEVNQALQQAHLLQQYPSPDLGIDFLSVSSHNIGPNKLDTWLTRDVTYDVGLDAGTGDLTATVAIELTNDAPDGLPSYMLGIDYTIGADVARNPNIERDPAANRTIISIYTPHELVRSESPTNPETEFVSWNEFGYERHTASLEVQPGDTATITFELTGQIEPGDYHLFWASQPLVNPDDVHLTVHGTNGWKLGAGATSYDFEHAEDTQIVVPATND